MITILIICVSRKRLYIASHRIASHRIASDRIGSDRIASHRIASRPIPSSFRGHYSVDCLAAPYTTDDITDSKNGIVRWTRLPIWDADHTTKTDNEHSLMGKRSRTTASVPKFQLRIRLWKLVTITSFTMRVHISKQPSFCWMVACVHFRSTIRWHFRLINRAVWLFCLDTTVAHKANENKISRTRLFIFRCGFVLQIRIRI